VVRFLPSLIGLSVALAPVLARAQTNLDQGKSAAQIFASVCSECHKAPRGLANGKNVSAVADFLHEHYTTSREQAAALAAYVAGGRGGEPIGGAAQGRGQKPAADHAASAEEPKPPKHQGRQPAKPEEGKPDNAKLRGPGREESPQDEANRADQPNITGPEHGPRERQSATTGRNRRKEPKTPEAPSEVDTMAHTPAAATAEPAASQVPGKEESPMPSAAAPADAKSGDAGENAPVPRDNIPD
jgi:cytochrome c553